MIIVLGGEVMLVIEFIKLLWAAYIIIIKSRDLRSSRVFTFGFDLASFSSNFSFTSLTFADCFFSMNSASAYNSAIFSFSFKAMPLFDDLFDEELDDDFLLTDFLETLLFEQIDALCFMVAPLSSSASFIQLRILFLNDSMSSSTSSNHSSSSLAFLMAIKNYILYALP